MDRSPDCSTERMSTQHSFLPMARTSHLLRDRYQVSARSTSCHLRAKHLTSLPATPRSLTGLETVIIYSLESSAPDHWEFLLYASEMVSLRVNTLLFMQPSRVLVFRKPRQTARWFSTRTAVQPRKSSWGLSMRKTGWERGRSWN